MATILDAGMAESAELLDEFGDGVDGCEVCVEAWRGEQES